MWNLSRAEAEGAVGEEKTVTMIQKRKMDPGSEQDSWKLNPQSKLKVEVISTLRDQVEVAESDVITLSLQDDTSRYPNDFELMRRSAEDSKSTKIS